MSESKAPRILVLEDDLALRSVLRDFLTLMHYEVMEAADIAGFRKLSSEHSIDLLLLDLNLPDGDGLNLLREMCSGQGAPVFVVSGRCDEHSRLKALEAGADDYIVKPFNARELEFRIRNFLRRQRERIGVDIRAANPSLRFGEWQLLPDQYRVAGPQGDIINVTRSERDLLQELLSAQGSLRSRRQLASAISSPTDTTSEETVTVLIYRLRKKLEQAGAGAQVIETVAGAGYRIAATVGNESGA